MCFCFFIERLKDILPSDSSDQPLITAPPRLENISNGMKWNRVSVVWCGVVVFGVWCDVV